MEKEYIDIKHIKKLNRQAGRFFFSQDTMRFFRSRCPRTAIKIGNKAYFVTSEQFDDKSPRRYTVRICDLETGEVDTVGKIRVHRDSQSAYTAINKILEGSGSPTCSEQGHALG